MKQHPFDALKRCGPALAALILGATLAACDHRTADTPRTNTADTAAAATPAPPGPSDPSVPDAKAALAAQGASAGTVPAQPDANASLSKAQESTQMPLPGQTNDHSLPSTDKRATQGDVPASAAQPASAR